MTESTSHRLPSPHFEDLAFIVLSARPDLQGFSLYPDIDDALRSRLKSRLRQLFRYDWPSCVREDPDFRKGITLQQCYRLMVGLLLVDAQLPPSLAVMLAQHNELGFLRTVASSLGNSDGQGSNANDLFAAVFATEIQKPIGFPDRAEIEEDRILFVQKNQIANLWSGDLSCSGARIVINITAPSTALWRWISERRLMDDTARLNLLAQIDSHSTQPPFERKGDRKQRR